MVAAKEYVIGRSLGLQEAFVREARHLCALRHPNVVALQGVSVAGDRGIVLLEYCEGGCCEGGRAGGRHTGVAAPASVACCLPHLLSVASATCLVRFPLPRSLPAGRDLHAALGLRLRGTDQRLFGWHCRGRHVALDVARALDFLASRNIVHLDM